MENQRLSKLYTWREKYGALVIALACLYSAISSWGQNWVLTSVLVFGTFVCGIFGFFDIKRAFMEKGSR
ncbi:hypothetical protein VKA52_04835 [Halobacillus sp. HZG1]|uniref:hypothetical protein n=1 Tax=Halobacillus sp. HZG1 TaxID=3111769 RepID=UPI002DB65AB0|nr:hypothetical protein [Halobacillus sp. HZG1]MEC3883056.1 hypothetical protein [Halobacillus sp. HZG1]